MRAVKNLPFNTAVFLILSVIITLFCALVFAVGQQIYRQTGNDPQIQLSEDLAKYLGTGQDMKVVIPKTEIDIAQSLVWFVMVFDPSGQVIASNGKLNGQNPEVPKGVLDYAMKNGQNRVTWEPQKGVRVAAVVTSYNGGEVMVGRSLKETENRVKMLMGKVVMVWIVAMILTFVGTWVLLPKRLH